MTSDPAKVPGPAGSNSDGGLEAAGQLIRGEMISYVSVQGNHGSWHYLAGIRGRQRAVGWPAGCRHCCHYCLSAVI